MTCEISFYNFCESTVVLAADPATAAGRSPFRDWLRSNVARATLPEMDRTQAITGASALVGRDLTLVRDAVVTVEGGTIGAAGPRGEVGIPDGAEIVDASGLTLIPGFIDAHVHIGLVDPHRLVAGGVTTARDLAWPPDVIHPLVRDSRRADFDGPTLLAAGPMLTAEGGYPTRASWAPRGSARVVRGAAEARGMVEQTAAEGAAVIKVALNADVGPVLDGQTLATISDAAHDLGLRVTAHVSSLAELDKAIGAGVDELAHMVLSRERIPNETIASMVRAGMAVVPTLSIRSGRDLKAATQNLGRFLEAGGRVVYGTDLGNKGPEPGIDRREVEAMATAGLSPRDVIATATSDSARWLGLETKGAIEAGLDADIAALRGDPLSTPRALTETEMVWRAGRRVGSPP